MFHLVAPCSTSISRSGGTRIGSQIRLARASCSTCSTQFISRTRKKGSNGVPARRAWCARGLQAFQVERVPQVEHGTRSAAAEVSP